GLSGVSVGFQFQLVSVPPRYVPNSRCIVSVIFTQTASFKGMEIFSRRRIISPLIVAIVFITFFHNVLSKHKIRHYKDRFKRQQGANLYLPGSYIQDNNDEESGPWEEWSAPSPCSRTCGGGVSTQNRKCTQGYECTGPSARYVSCNTQDCPDQADFRSQQCADHNAIPFEGALYEWVPYTKAPNPCELNCMPKGERFYYRHADAVVDGTRCNDEAFDVCVNGTCQPVGCDRMLGSNAREDQCRVCGGDGSTCNTFTNTIPMKDMQVGYNDILLIPAGATNIRVEELAPSNNYLAVRNKTGFYYLNGNWRIDFPRSIDFAGTRFKYDRQPQEFDAPDILTALGPTDESLFIVLLYQGADIPISYSYSLPTSVPPPSTERYSWIYDEFTPCSAKCGRGVQYRNVSCAGRNSLEPADETLCDKESKPQSVQSCNEFDCEATWIINPWSACSYPCGKGGTKTRQITCQKTSSNGLQEVVGDEICSEMQSKPPTEEKCNEGKTCSKWHTDPWKPCDHLCGPGKQTRKVICYTDTNGKKEVRDNNECEQVESKPEEEKDCVVRPCEGVDWLMSQWTGCDKCGLTNETRKVFCATASGEIQADDLCDQERKPEVVRECEVANNACQYLWYASQWSECSANCGQGVQTRTIFCGASTVNGVQKVENDKCDPSKNFDTIKNCTGEKETCDGEWFSGPWGECSKPCGGGERSKKVVCVKENQVVDASSCDSSNIEFSEETCNQQPCSEDTIIPTDITQAVDESEPTKESSQKREATTTPITTGSEDTDGTEGTVPSISDASEVTAVFEGTTSRTPTTTENPDDFEIVPDDNCDDGEWVDVEEEEEDENEKLASEMPQGDDPFAFDDIMLGDQNLLVGSGDGEGSSSSSSTWSTDSSTSTDSTWSTESSLSTSEFEGSGFSEFIGESDVGVKTVTTTRASTVAFTGSTESTVEFTGSTSEPETTTEFTGSTEFAESTTTGSTESTEFTDSTEPSEITTEFTGSTESTESTTEGSTESTIEFTGSTESTESTTAGSTESTTEFTGSTESTESTTAGSTETTTEYTGSTESTESTTVGSTETTTEFTGSTESTESTTAGSTETTIEFTGSTESTETTTAGSTESTESTTTGSTESTESTTVGSTESTESTTVGSTESTESTTVGSTESTESTTVGSTESTESTTAGSTESTESTTEGSTESTTAFTGSTESTESTTEGSTESTTEFTGSTETTESTTEGSTESTTEFTGSTESTESTTEGSTESTTEFTGSTESTESTSELTTEYGTTSITELFTKKPRMCKRRKIKGCQKTKFGCCWDNITPAEGPFDKGCPTPHTCKEAKYGCCDDGVSAALGPKKGGCPRSQCKETLFGCCPDNKTPAEGNDNEGCPPECLISEYGCCDDNSTKADGPNHKGCPEESTTEISTTEFSTVSSETEITSEYTSESGSTVTESNCESSPYRCCPDGVTSATGPGFQGCNLPCSESTFGCCQDAKTPAHGPSGEGCCLSSPFGCCPDNISPARGTNNDGCDCQFAPYGCCPDNKTSAQGYEKEGCGCDYTEFGCCPDGYTKAEGPDLQGCLCHTFQFGCCPDGITSAKGPHGQGCGCRNSEFGCCSDEKTSASGPNMEGCKCENTKFGCCLDGIGEAKGENFEGCASIPENLQVGCSIPKERGTCRNYTVKWFFDMDYGGCSRFWYGGCDGNENRYKSKEECEQICVNPEGDGRCHLSKVAGPCEGYYPQWYYDKSIKNCAQFIYGGCLGNNNRFETREECLGLCVKDRGADPCQQQKDEGPCQGQFQRYFFDKENKQCTEFTYGGCKGSNNNFATAEACRQQCAPSGERKDYCLEPKAEGNCTDVYATWFYDTPKKSCSPFYYTGCNGNLNNFPSKEACEAQCPPEIEKDTCQLPAETGDCANYVDRWYYDTREKTCRQFYYGGCGGNGNNFETQQRCQERCERVAPPQDRTQTEVQPVPTEGTPKPFSIDQCFQPRETGPCRAAFTKYFYDTSDGVCKSFIYGGCRGNGNRFDRIEDCLQNCGNAQDLCTLPAVQGDCEGEYPQYYYDQSSDSCQAFTYTGCGGNYNRFQDQQSCEQRCKKSVPQPTYTQAPTSASQAVMCFESPDPGNCDERITAFYYDPSRRLCQPFIYSGCGGNNNRFNSEEQCQRQCGDFKDQDVCKMQRDPGPCRGYFVKYYYEASSGSCNQFAYGGCQGNGNRFSTEEECAQICITHQENKPNLTATALCRLPVDKGSCEEGYHKRWYFDDSRGECLAFIFSGCGGNFNNFKSYQHCIEYCRELLPPPIEPQITTDMAPHPCQEAFDECTTLRCPYGVEPFVDENECNRCRCRDPCSEVDCLEDEQCAIDLNTNKTSPQDADFLAICRKQNKPGYCPSQIQIVNNNCEEECRTDADCTVYLKCCSTGCGTACVDPTPPGQLVTQQSQPAYTEGPDESQYQPPHVDPIEYKPEVAASIGDQATLRCAVSGNPNPQIRWSKDSIEIDGTQPRYRIKLDQSLQIITLHKTDSGIYLCTASNGLGNPITNQIKLEVIDSEHRPVSILAEPGDEQPLIVSLNGPATLNCYVLGYPFPAVTWWKDDSIIPFKNNEFEIRKDYSLLIHSVRLQNLGIYTCQAYNGFGKAASWSVTVKTRGPINFVNPLDRQYNKFVVYPEEYSSPNIPSVTTPRIDVPLQPQRPNTPYYTPYVPSYTEPSNEIIPNTLPDAQAGRPPPSVTVPAKANITTNDQKYPDGSDIEIPCEFSGYPTPIVQWFKDGVELFETDKIHIRETERNSVLTIEQATKADSGYYQCEVTNNYSKASSAMEISIQGMYIHPSCTDNQFFANCALIVKAKYCTHKYYAKFCCRSCTEAGLLPVDGPHIQNFNRQNSLNNNLI
ncbi:unnamed protein product, partial [Psylliodes chrysocephalus]